MLPGLHEKPNLDEFRRVCDDNKDVAANPITLLTGLLHSEQDAFNLHQRLKLSAFERDLAKYLTLNRESTRGITELL